jgi:hydroxymethylpyrimidine/phosphomethylpyrimidine kinase
VRRTALTIAGSDSSGGAGIQADLKTFAAFGLHGASAITAITAQNTLGIAASMPLPADLVTAQIEAVAGDLAIHATKIGMLGTGAIVEAVAAAIEELDLPRVVLDPVLISKSGTRLLEEDEGVQALRAELLPRALVVTPNLPEAAVLCGRPAGPGDPVLSPEEAREAARRIHEMGAAWVVITGGHRHGAEVVDLVFDGRTFTELRAARVETPHTHGTGCTLASAIAAGLALGDSPGEAAARARRYVTGALQHAFGIGRGHGPLDHFWGGILKG